MLTLTNSPINTGTENLKQNSQNRLIMKLRYTLPIASTLVVTIFAWVTTAKSQEPPAEAEETPSQRMEARQQEIFERIGLPAPMELPEPGEPDFAAEAIESGWIMEVTLEEVEAALEAAKATPSREDDVVAMRMAHRGSYRFFLDDASVSPRKAKTNH